MKIYTKPFTEGNVKQLKSDGCSGVCFSKNKKTGAKHICPNYKTIERCDREKKSDINCLSSSDRRNCIGIWIDYTRSISSNNPSMYGNMMKTVKIDYAGATIEVLDFVADRWPFELPSDKWPTFCGAGSGLGEKLVPDQIFGISVSHLCFDHDCGFCTGPDTQEAWHAHNKRLYRNLVATIIASDLPRKEMIMAVNECAAFFLAVESPFGYAAFSPSGEDIETNIALQEKFKRLTDHISNLERPDFNADSA